MSDFLKKARVAEQQMRALFPATPLQRNDHLSAAFDADIWLKREDLSPVRSYKIRGALNAMGKALARDPSLEVFVCASAGNHAQGVAYVSRHFGVKGVIFMPVTTPQQKIEKTRIFGGENVEIRLIGDYFDSCMDAARAYCAETGGYFLSPFDDLDVIEGQASVAAEMTAQLGRMPDMVVLPVGGGGLSAGITQYLDEVAPEVDLRYVEPRGGQSLRAALEAGHPVRLQKVDSFVDGAAVAQIGAHPFEVLKDIAPEKLLEAPEDRICTTIIEMLNVEGIVLEPAGALAVDALKDLQEEIRGKTVVCVTSGGNFDFERLPEVKERAQRYMGVKKYFILRLPQRPGALKEFLTILGPDDNISRFEYMKKNARNFGSVLIGIETTVSENFDTLFERLDASDFVYSDITEDETIAEFVV